MFNRYTQIIANWPMLYLVYGLSFFLLGFAIILQHKRSSRLMLARTLPWLALFALFHGAAEWGYLLIPLNEPYLSTETVQDMKILQIMLWNVSFFFLICFGLALFWRYSLKQLTLWHLGGLAAMTLAALWLIDHSAGFWLTGSGVEIFARYVLCIPGASLAALGLYHRRDELRHLGSGRLLAFLNLAVAGFAGYALAGGLIVPAAGLFPASVINTAVFKELFGFPVELLRAGMSVIIAFSILKILRMYDLEDLNRMAEVNRKEALVKERERIARDLHDGVIQSIYAVGLTLQKLRKTGPFDEGWAKQMGCVLNCLDDVVTDIRKYISDLSNEDGRELIGALKWLEGALPLPVEFKADSSSLARLSPTALNNINLIIREALMNIAKHAQATKAAVHMNAQADGFRIEIRDDGIGISHTGTQSPKDGEKRGLINIQARAACLNGRYSISSDNTGTVVQVWIPWEGNMVGEQDKNSGCR